MAILKIKDADGNVHEILAIRGNDGKDYVLTEADKQEIANMIGGGGADVDLSDYYTKNATDAMLNQKLDKSNFDAVYSGRQSAGLEIEGNTVISIGECTDVNIVIPEFAPDGTRITEIADGVFGVGLGANFEDLESITFPPSIQKLNGEVINTAYCSNLKTLHIMNPYIEWDNTEAIVIDGIPVDIFYGATREAWADINTSGSCPLLRTMNPVPTMHYAHFTTKEQVLALIQANMPVSGDGESY